MDVPPIDRACFARDGYAVVRGVVPTARHALARRAINNWLVNGFDSTCLDVYNEQSYAPEIQSSDAIVGLCTGTPVLALADSLVGRPLLAPDSGQIALRFPAALDADVASDPSGGHIDGLPSANNGVPNDGRVYAFTVLAGVLLSDIPEPGRGNFTVWPGTHHEMARWFREHGTTIRDPADVYEANRRVAEAGGPPVAVTGHAGDVVFAHHLLVHTVGPHTGPDVRYAVFFRLRVRPWDEYDDGSLTNPWHEFEGIAPATRDGRA